MKKILSLTFILVLLAAFGYSKDYDWTYKWSQLPDMEQSGMDIEGTDPTILADDFLCENGLPITDLHWWGSYIGWMEDVDDPNPTGVMPQHPDAFKFSMHMDVRAGVDAPYSHPGQQIYGHIDNNYNVEYFGTVNHGGVFEHVFQYNYILPEAWMQEQGLVYWLDLSAIYDTGQPDYRWGWHTSKTQWNDSAVVNSAGTPVGWVPIADDPIKTDLAFEISTVPEPGAMFLFFLGAIGWFYKRIKNRSN